MTRLENTDGNKFNLKSSKSLPSKLESGQDSCEDRRADSLKCLVKFAAHPQKRTICSKFFASYKECIKTKSAKDKADRIAARGGSIW
tara:strand:- start:400 stop:660 length:261 start_codon:yes stop_codon:yes gene_type:complete